MLEYNDSLFYSNIMQNYKSYNSWLDFLRASAIILVLLSHGRHFLIPLFPQANILKLGGFLGVELFFVLSGFLVGRILIRSFENNDSAGWIPRFWFRRWMRTYPNYFLFLIINLVFVYHFNYEFLKKIPNYLTFTQSLLKPHPDFFMEAWSLAVEEVFYFITPLVFILVSLLSKKNTIVISIFLIISVSLILRINAVLSDPTMTFNEVRSTALYRLDSIMIGVIFYILRDNYKIRRVSFVGVILLMPIILYFASTSDTFLNQSNLSKIFLPTVTSICFGCLLISGLNLSNCYIKNKIIVNIARWSYATYLINIPVFFGLFYVINPKTIFVNLVSWVLFIFLSFYFSCIVFKYYESMFFKLRDKIVPKE